MKDMEKLILEYCETSAQLRQLERKLTELRKALEALPAGVYTARQGKVSAVLTVTLVEKEIVKPSAVPRAVLEQYGAVEKRQVKVLKGELVK